MLGTVMWGALSVLSFGVFFTLPSTPTGADYVVLVPAIIALAAAMLKATQVRNRPVYAMAAASSKPAVVDDAVIARTERLKHERAEEEGRMLRHQSSRRRAARH